MPKEPTHINDTGNKRTTWHLGAFT